MPEFLETIESIRAEEASTRRLFEGEGQGVRQAQKGQGYQAKLAEAAKFVGEVMQGKKPAYHLREAMTTSDFPLLFGDILDRQLLANYRETPAPYRNYVRIANVPDFRKVKRYQVDGGAATLGEVAEMKEYPETNLTEAEHEYSVKKYGRRMPFSWEAIINGDLDALQDIPRRFGRAARRTEAKFASELFFDANGPKSAATTTITGNPELSIDALQTAMKEISEETDEDGEPIMIDMLHLVVCPGLEVTANNILQSTELRLREAGGVDKQELIVANWVRNRLVLHVDPYIPQVVTDGDKGSKSWMLVADPDNNRPAAEVGFLRGNQEPQIFLKAPNAQLPGGEMAGPMQGDFDTDSIQYKVRHVFGGTHIDKKMAYASHGE